ncbi:MULTISPECIES: hypothetical protein [unclassified Enterococcus]|uniref:hypothetical protein n=1 Tax=unclassified Enterococcus TaxID=2608891 RepID=UPI000A348489|nr:MULTISPECIES: hypothetical protein [unclassified Enterococcus]OTO76860.1 hypothetical protein A5865_000718 [Enterococcus sp. 12E11_DIV0728]OUZ16980.1 hypothetical protein A5868_001919 [Enterococcus sp. 12F9_DIV0723]
MNDAHLSFHHIGKPVPLEQLKNHPDVKYSPLFDMYSLDKKNDLSLPIELHAFGPNSTLDPLIQKEPHVAFKVSDIDKALVGQTILMPLYQPFADYRCAMILVSQQPIELIETTLSEAEIWGDGIYKDSILYE